MKKQSSNSFKPMSIANKENPSIPGSEAFACGTNLQRNKVFTAAELWEIQRHGKRRIQRRFDF